MTDKFNTGVHALDHQSEADLQGRTRKSAERSELREALLQKLRRPTKVSKAADKLTTEEEILEQLRQINAKLGTAEDDNSRYLLARQFGTYKPHTGSVPSAPHESHKNAGFSPDAMIAEFLKGRIL